MGAPVQGAEICYWDYIPHPPCPWKVDFAPMVLLSPHPFVMLLKNPGGSCSSSDIQAEQVESHDRALIEAQHDSWVTSGQATCATSHRHLQGPGGYGGPLSG